MRESVNERGGGEEGEADHISGRKLLRGLGRACGGALIFGLPMLMTMEMWWLGFYVERSRLALLLILNLPLLVLLSHHAGFERTFRWQDDLRDALIAYGVGILSSAVLLAIFGVLTLDMPVRELAGKVAIQSVPTSIGAILGRSLLGGGNARATEGPGQPRYWGELFLMTAGALYLSFNLAPTEEMVLISYKMTAWHALVLIGLSLLLMHAFVYALEFRGTEPTMTPDAPWWSHFLQFTVVGYVLAALISLYVLWTFGRTEDVSLAQIAMAVAVLGFPASIGAAAARLIL